MSNETPLEKYARIKQNLTPEMMFAIRFQAFGLAVFLVVATWVGFQEGWGWYGMLLGGFFLYLNSTYWATYIKRGIDRRFERDQIRKDYEEKKAKEEPFEPPPGRLLGNDRTQRFPPQAALPGGSNDNNR